MSQFGSNQVPPAPAYSNTNNAPPIPGAPSTQTQQLQQLPPGPGGINAQPGYYLPPHQDAFGVPEDEKENPCRCCCGLAKAATVLVILNLVYFVVSLGVSIWYLDNQTIAAPDGYIRVATEGGILFRECTRLDDEGTRPLVSVLLYWILLLTWAVKYLVDLALQLVFGITVAFALRDPGLDRKILFSSLYMWYHLSFPGAILLVIYCLAAITKYDGCNSQTLWVFLLFGIVCHIPSNIFYGLVGRAYRNVLRRRSPLPMHAGRAGETPMPMQTPTTGIVAGSGTGAGDAVPENQESGPEMEGKST